MGIGLLLRHRYWNVLLARRIHFFWAFLFLNSLALTYSQLILTRQQVAQFESDLHPGVGYLKESYDPALARLSSLEKLLTYTDSLQRKQPNVSYPVLLSWTIRRKFYHGFSYYDTHNNPLASLIARTLGSDLHAIVLPDDILQHPNAGCSQQAIVFMAALRQRGFTVRNVGFYEPIQGGHYALEVLYNGSWHYFDTDFEPSFELLNRAGRPSMGALLADTTFLQQVYRGRMEPQRIRALFSSYRIGDVNPDPAPRARLFQLTTKGLMYVGWLVILALWLMTTKISVWITAPLFKHLHIRRRARLRVRLVLYARKAVALGS
ncbi:hypothetical protein DNI29_19225 [Hymenobacter sediminis]|uniref:hypothetical protein n=1 Tax=Hymenobacter sediminis TaxID=2218621 RepID=UPI000DA6581D|nr:hypothetical protein [Hymenobacter sediminis]RPD44842.1 hypothetical protein DNI29_19225 [Hymenobacter sediminis]